MNTNEQTILKLRAALEREVTEAQLRADRDGAQLNEISRINNALVNARREAISAAESARQNADKVKVSETRYRRLFESAKDGILILDAVTGKIEDVNPFLCQLLGYAPEDFVGKQLWEIGTFRDIAANQGAFRELQKKEYIRHDDLPLETKDGQSVSVEFISNVYMSGDKQVIQCNIRDNSERKQAEVKTTQAQAQTEEQRQRLNTILATVPGIVWEAWGQPNISIQQVNFVSDYVETMLGYTVADWLAAPNFWLSIVHPEDKAQAECESADIFAGGREGVSQFRWIAKDGRVVWVESHMVVVCDDAGHPCGLRGVTMNITERKQSEQALRESESRKTAIFETALDCIISIDEAGRVIEFNPAAEKIFGYAREETIGQLVADLIIPPALREQHQRGLAHFLAKGEGPMLNNRIEVPAMRADGTELLVELAITPVELGESNIFTGYLRDITKRQQTEIALRRSESLFRALVQNSWNGFQLVQPDGQITYESPASARLLGYSSEEMEGHNALEFVHPDDAQEMVNGGQALLESPGKIRTVVIRIRHKDGSWRWIESYEINLLDHPDVGAIAVNYHDITERKIAEEERDRFFTLSLDMLAIVGSDGYFKRLNPAFETTLGFSNAELIAVPFLEFVHPDDIASTLSEMAKLESGTKVMRFENRYHCRDGSYKWLQWMSAPFEELWYCVAHDVTEIKRTEQVIRESEEYFRFLNDLSEATRTLADPEQIMAEMSRMLGEHLSVSRCAYADVEPDGEEFTILHDYTNGCASTVGKYKLSLFGPRAVATLSRGETLIIRDVEAELLPDEGAAMFNAIGIQAIIVCPLVKKGVLRGMMAVHQTTPRDWQPSEITLVQDVVERCWSTIERRTAEEKIYLLNADLEHRVIERTSQLESANTDLQIAREAADTANLAKSEFLSRMSHELRTPLNAILGFGQILEMDDMPPRRRENVQYILKGGRHLLDLINEVLDISRIEAGHIGLSIEPVPVNSTVLEMLDLVRPLTIVGHIELINEIPPNSDWHMLADRQRLNQVLLNLTSNAIKYNRDGGSVTVFGEKVSEPAVSGQSEEQHGVLRLSIRDTGHGLSKDDIAKLFVPFERLDAAKTRIEGTGIGLALSKRLIEAMGGQIGVWSTPGQDSTFWIELPLVPSPLQSALEQPETSALQTVLVPNGERKTVLYIEDNLANLQLIEVLLGARPDVRLLTAMQGSTGLDLAFEHNPDLILLDLDLPDFNGDEVLRRLRADDRTRNIPVVIISADATPGQIERLLAEGAKTYLTKPLNVKEFLSVLEEIFQGKE